MIYHVVACVESCADGLYRLRPRGTRATDMQQRRGAAKAPTSRANLQLLSQCVFPVAGRASI